MSTPAHALNWFEIPVTDFDRARTFYEKVLGTSIQPMAMGPITMGLLTTDMSVVGGAIVKADGVAPSQEGTIVYLNGGDDLDVMLARVQPAGGTVAVQKTEIGNDFGFFAYFIDSEGNKVGLHSMR
jgi:predicted enzyme related to lactoylglutathione lyase